MSSALFRHALGAQFDQLAPALRRHYDLPPGHAVTLRGEMEVEARWSWLHRVLPQALPPSNRVEVVVHNAGVRDATGEIGYEWRRTFRYPDGRTFARYTLTRSAPIACAFPCVMDTFPPAPVIGLAFAVLVQEGGQTLVQRTARAPFVQLGKRWLPLLLPPARITVEAVERACDESTIEAEVRVAHLCLGELFAYRGWLRVVEVT